MRLTLYKIGVMDGFLCCYSTATDAAECAAAAVLMLMRMMVMLPHSWQYVLTLQMCTTRSCYKGFPVTHRTM